MGSGLRSSPRGPRLTHDSLSDVPCGVLGLIFIVFLALSLGGCAGRSPKQSRPADDFLGKWKVKAEASKGHSPSERARNIDLPEGTKQEEPPREAPRPEAPKILPDQKVSLRMHNADVITVLRALARSVGQNILINDKVKGTISVDMEAVPWDEAFRGILKSQGLDYTWEGDLLRIMTVEDMENDLKMDAIREKQKAQRVEARRVEPLLVKVIPIDYGDAAKLQEKLKEYLSKDEKGNVLGSLTVDEHTNSLVINAIRDDIIKLAALVGELDKPTPQILIESSIIEATKDTAHRLGVQWGGLYMADNVAVTPGGQGGSGGDGSWVYDALTGATGIAGQGQAVNLPVDVATGGGASLGLIFGKLGADVLDIQLSALQSEGKLNILSSPSITTLDNQTAFTENGERIPYVSIGENGDREVKFEDAVLRLEITPHVISGDHLKMKIVVKKDEVDFTRKVEENPLIIKKQTQTTLISKDGETIVISGLSRSRTRSSDKGVPGFSNTPILGALFRSEDKGNTMEEVLIFITPHILESRNAGPVAKGEGKPGGGRHQPPDKAKPAENGS